MKTLLFTYGLFLDRAAGSRSGSKFLGVYRARNYKFTWRNFANIEPQQGATAYGVCYEVTDPDAMEDFDKTEGYPHFYRHVPIIVENQAEIDSADLAIAFSMDEVRPEDGINCYYCSNVITDAVRLGIPTDQYFAAADEALARAKHSRNIRNIEERIKDMRHAEEMAKNPPEIGPFPDSPNGLPSEENREYTRKLVEDDNIAWKIGY
jgi:hypothetical protein